jgi:CubicO group peptidase (beta-lactamase class C family)
MKMKLLLTLLAFVWFTTVKAQPSFIKDSLENYIQQGMKQWEIPGLAIVIVKDGKIVLMKGYGVKEMGKNDPVDENTLFMIASNSKLFTATSLAKLEAEKKLSLNDKVTKYIPWYKLYDPNVTSLVTIRDVLSHRLGTKTFQGDFTFWNASMPRDTVIWKMRTLVPSGVFRQDYGYCNSGYVTAGKILETVTGMKWEDYIEDNFLKPLGMNNSFPLTAGMKNRKNVAVPHSSTFSKLTTIPYDEIDDMAPAGSMISCVNDLSKWLLFQLDSGRLNGQQIIPWQAMMATRDISTVTNSRKSKFYPTHINAYGMGLFMTDYNGKMVYWHTGGADGFVSNTCFVPEENLGIAILTNNDNQNFFEALRYQILDAYLGVPYVDRSNFQWGFHLQAMNNREKELKQMEEKVTQHNKLPLPAESFTGDYTHPVYGAISITKEGNNLIVHFSHHPQLTAKLEYMGNNEFRCTYSNIAYGIYPANFTLKDNKVVSVTLKVNDFLEFDPYTFIKNK